MPHRRESHPASRPGWQRAGCIVAPLAGLLLCGLYGYLILWRPARTVIAARHWTAVPCQITSSQVVRRPDTGTRTVYKLDIRYRYTFGDLTFTSGRYDAIDDDGSGGYESKQRTASRHPPGTMTTCYVNPKAPGEALIDRGFPARMWWGILPAAGILLCLSGLAFAVGLEIFDRTA